VEVAVALTRPATAFHWRPALDVAAGVSVLVVSATDSTFAREYATGK
jgi:hypothetical protein